MWWENRWYPIVSAVLTRHHPEIRESVFPNLPQVTGSELGSRLLDRDRSAHFLMDFAVVVERARVVEGLLEAVARVEDLGPEDLGRRVLGRTCGDGVLIAVGL